MRDTTEDTITLSWSEYRTLIQRSADLRVRERRERQEQATVTEAALRKAANSPVVWDTTFATPDPYLVVYTRDAPKASVLERARELLTGRRQRVCPHCGAFGQSFTPEAEWQRQVAACGAEHDLTKPGTTPRVTPEQLRSYDAAVEAWRRNDR